MTHYNVGYMDNSHKHQEICVTATDSYDAKRIVCEDVPYICLLYTSPSPRD